MSKAKPKIWVSRVFVDSTRIKGFDSDISIENMQLAVDAMQKSKKGEPLGPERFPKEMYGKYPDKKHRSILGIFMANGFWTVSAECAEVLQNFNLGKTRLYPVKLFQHDRKTPVEGDYFCVSFGETKEAVLVDQSPSVRENSYTPGLFRLFPDVAEYGVKVTPDALKGCDLWVDSRLDGGLFLSDRLVQALKAAKLTRFFGLRKCEIIPGSA